MSSHSPCGHWHKLPSLIEADPVGTLWAWGRDNSYQLGLGFDVPKSGGFPIPFLVPTQVGTSGDWCGMCTGYYTPYILKNVSSSISKQPWGIGYMYWLGNYYMDPTLVNIARNISFLHCLSASKGNLHEAIIKNTGDLWMLGDNSYGQLGQGNTSIYNDWVQVGNDSDWEQVCCGHSHTIGIKRDGDMYVWGRTYYGATNQDEPTQIDGHWQKATAGFVYTLAVHNDGSLWVCGVNSGGNLGIGTAGHAPAFVRIPGIMNPLDFSAQELTTAVINHNGDLYTCGVNTYGDLGLGDTTPRLSLTKVGEGFIQVSTGYYHMLAIKADGTLWSCGYNTYGELGLNDTTNRSSLVQVGSYDDWFKVKAAMYYSHGIRRG